MMRSMAELWRVKLAKVFKMAGEFEEILFRIASDIPSFASCLRKACLYRTWRS